MMTMKPDINSQVREKGLTLIEVMVAIVLIVVAVIGAAGFRYYCALDAKKADVEMTAARLGMLLLEDWKCSASSSSYDPVSQFNAKLNISSVSTGIVVQPAGFNLLGVYSISEQNVGVNYGAALSYTIVDLTEPDMYPISVKVLNATVGWPVGSQTGPTSSNVRSVSLSTYAD
ncbi:MAG: prepilin-type N-terminal cleavage/methylation domain-containing protein [Sedimentisphaerales bacterium]|nr:prepilin-type N-terminal cleavage/methylation domain-containing protein [Sedimentisphaerales bacterium]